MCSGVIRSPCLSQSPVEIYDHSISMSGIRTLSVGSRSDDCHIPDPTGDARSMKVTLIGRPGTVETRQQCVVFRMQGKPPGSLPKGLPPVPNAPPLTWTVMVALRQWNRVKDSLTMHQDDALIVEG